MPETGDPRVVVVSEDKLRGLFAEFKLDLFTELQKYATLVALQAVEHRLDDLREQIAERVGKLELWRANREGGGFMKQRISAGMVAWIGLTISTIATALTWYLSTRHH